MALSKTIELPSGVTVTYHRILRIAANYEGAKGMIQAEIGSYLDEDARRAGREPVRVQHVQLAIDGIEASREAIYAALAAPIPLREVMAPKDGAKALPQGGFAPEDMLVAHVPARAATGFEEAEAA